MSKNQVALLTQEGLTKLRVDAVDGREFLSGGRRFTDFCSTNYLSFDIAPGFQEKAFERARQWGSLMSWSRLEADGHIYPDLEARIAALTGAPQVHLGITITLTGLGVLPTLAGKGLVIADKKVHTVVWEACRLARDHGAGLVQFEHQNVAHLESILEANRRAVSPRGPVIVAIDGVYSISAERAPIAQLQELCRRYDAYLYIDDAHGFGILGEKPTAGNPYGVGGMGIIRHTTGDYRRTFYLSSFGKAFCTQLAFITIPVEYREDLATIALSNIYSPPVPPYTVGCVETALDWNDTLGEAARLSIRQGVTRFREGVASLGLKYSNEALHPVVFVEVGTFEKLLEVYRSLAAAGILAGLRAYPVVPANQCGLRFALTSAHTPAQIDRALGALADCRKLIAAQAA
jgi:8-amino-7-oxononanoate synthase